MLFWGRRGEGGRGEGKGGGERGTYGAITSPGDFKGLTRGYGAIIRVREFHACAQDGGEEEIEG